MEITPEYLERQIEALRQQRDAAKTQWHSLDGAVQALEQTLAYLNSKPESKVEEEVK